MMVVVASVTQVELEISKQVLRTGDSYWVFGDKKRRWAQGLHLYFGMGSMAKLK